MEIPDRKPDLLHHLPVNRLFNGLPGFRKSGDQRVIFIAPPRISAHQKFSVMNHSDNHGRTDHRIAGSSAFRAAHHPFLFVVNHRHTAVTAEAALLIPLSQAASHHSRKGSVHRPSPAEDTGVLKPVPGRNRKILPEITVLLTRLKIYPFLYFFRLFPQRWNSQKKALLVNPEQIPKSHLPFRKIFHLRKGNHSPAVLLQKNRLSSADKHRILPARIVVKILNMKLMRFNILNHLFCLRYCLYRSSHRRAQKNLWLLPEPPL